MFLQVILNVSYNGIKSLHISMSLATNTRYISMLFSDTELFLLFIPALQCKSVGLINETSHIEDPGILLQTINIRDLKVK